MIGLGDAATATEPSLSTLSATRWLIFFQIGRPRPLLIGFASIPALKWSPAIVPVPMQTGSVRARRKQSRYQIAGTCCAILAMQFVLLSTAATAPSNAWPNS